MENTKAGRFFERKKSELSLNINAKTVLQMTGFVLLSVLLGQGSVFEELYPFGFALITATSGLYSFLALVGTSIGFLISHSGIFLFRYLVCAVSLWVIRSRVLNSHSRLGNIWFVAPSVCFLVCFMTGVAVVLPSGGGPDEIIVFAAEGFIVSVSAFFYRKDVELFMKEDEKVFTRRELPYLYLGFATVVASLGRIQFFGFSLALFISLLAIIVMSHIGSESGGGICACACAAALSGAVPDGYNVLPMIFAGVISGVFSPLGKFGCAASFVLSFSATALFTGEINALQNIITSAVVTAVYVAVPEKVYRKAGLFFRENKVTSQESTYRKDVSRKLSQTAETVTSICNGMNKVSENLRKIDSGYDRNIFCRVRQEVCSECDDKDRCWNKNFQYTVRGFEELTKNHREDKKYDDTSLGKLFLSKCLKSEELEKSMTRNFRKYDEKLKEEIRLDEKRSLMSQQMDCMSSMLRDFARTFSKCTLVDNELSPKVKDVFNSFSVRCTKAVCIIGAEGNMTVKANCKKIDGDIDRKKLKEEIEKISLRKFSDPEIDFTDTGTVVTFRQKPWMKMKVGKIQLSGEDSAICGDCLKEFTDEFGNRTVVLSDGMGTGGRAAVDAAMAAEYFGGLVENSVSFDNALKIVNSVLDLKSTSESLATIDAAHFNLFSGKVEFYKAGAAVSFVRKNGKCSVIESASLPAGILSEISFAKEKMMLSKGDIVVMVSDGVTNGKTDWIIKEIEEFNRSNPDILAQKIAAGVCDKSQGERRDDITVMVSIMTA